MSPPTVLEPLDALGTLLHAAAEPRAAKLPWRARLLDAVSSYLPLLLMGLLALGTWWLVKNTPVAEGAAAAKPPRHAPDYLMQTFSIQRFSTDGVLRAQIEGDTMRHYPDTDTVEIDNPRIKSFTTDGRMLLASARRGLGNGDASEVQLIGSAQVRREATATDEAIQFNGEFLHAFLKTEQVRSHLPATITRGGSEIRADTLSYDNLTRTVAMDGHVRATFAPPSAKDPVKPPARR